MKVLKYAALAACFLAPLGAQAQENYISQVIWLATNYCPQGTMPVSGQTLPIRQNEALYSLIGTNYGGDGRTTFMLPDLRSASPIGVSNQVQTGQRMRQSTCSQKSGAATVGVECIENPVSQLALTPCIVTSGNWPARP